MAARGHGGIGVPAGQARADANLAFDRSEVLLRMRVFGREVCIGNAASISSKAGFTIDFGAMTLRVTDATR
jgi:hypothetical protein